MRGPPYFVILGKNSADTLPSNLVHEFEHMKGVLREPSSWDHLALPLLA